jgi:hypothetical protein
VAVRRHPPQHLVAAIVVVHHRRHRRHPPQHRCLPVGRGILETAVLKDAMAKLSAERVFVVIIILDTIVKYSRAHPHNLFLQLQSNQESLQL